jgi:hypothetical protein
LKPGGQPISESAHASHGSSFSSSFSNNGTT